MILVDDVGGIFPAINHSPWDGVTLADLVMPFFLFIVGVSLAFAYKVVCEYYYSLINFFYSDSDLPLFFFFFFGYRTCHASMLQQERLCFDPLSSFHLVFFSKVWFLYSNHVL